jgi:putative peptide zinc metalloprotease protein
VFGGEVHEMGVMILVVTPVPYVDASAASAFPGKWQRVLVGAGGMVIEVFIAALAVFLWVAAEPGLLRSIAYNVIVIAGISTVLFNANPLLRFDGYHILMDTIEIPNLRQRASTYFKYLAERYAIGRRDAEAPGATPGERRWFVGFAITSSIYRVLVTIGILLYLAASYFWLAVILGTIAAIAWALVPLTRGVHYLAVSPRLRGVRGRAIVGVVTSLAVVFAVLAIPMPYRTLTEGVVWLPEESYVRPETEGFVERVVAAAGAPVRAGDPLLVLRNDEVSAGLAILQGQVREAQARYSQALPVDPVKAAMLLEDFRYKERDLARARERVEALTVRARTNGTFVMPSAESALQRFAKRGELLGFVVDLDKITVRAVVTQGTIDRVRQQTGGVEVRLAEQIGRPVPASLKRVVPAASDQLPSRALGSEGGGSIPVDPRDAAGARAVRSVFQIELELPSFSGRVNAGGRAYVRFDHGRVPLASQWYDEVRRLFLSRFNA